MSKPLPINNNILHHIRKLSPEYMAAFLISLAEGMLLAMITVAFSRYSWTGSTLGVVFVMAGFASIIYSFIYPIISYKHDWLFSPRLSAISLFAVTSLLFISTGSPLVWIIIYIIKSAITTVLYLQLELRIIYSSQKDTCVRLLAVFYILAILGFALGPILINIFSMSNTSIILTSLIFILGAYMVKKPKLETPTTRPTIRNILKIVTHYKYLWLICFIAGLSGESVDTFIGVYGLLKGFEETQALMLITWFMLGGILFQYPLSSLMDRSSKRYFIIILLFFSILVGATTLYWDTYSLIMILNVILWGSACYMIAIAGLALIGSHFSGVARIFAISFHALFYNAGTMVGPAIFGYSIDLWGEEGFITAFSVLLLATLAFGFLNIIQPEKEHRETMTGLE